MNDIDIEIKKIELYNNLYTEIFDNLTYLDYEDVYKKLGLMPDKLSFKLKYFFLILNYKKYINLYKNMIINYNNIVVNVDKHNSIIIKNEIENFNNICGLIENNELDDNQKDSIVRKNKNQLVIAGAGTGKTTTIIGKVKYLLKKGEYNPNDILLLSFTNASMTDMKERIKKDTGYELDVFTFHKLGLNIIKESTGNGIKIFDKDLNNLIKEILNELVKDSKYLKKLLYFMTTLRYETKDEFEFTTEEEYESYLSKNKPMTLKGETVKSYGELEIANYLFSNSIKYEYEKEYKINTMTKDYKQYTPDFYLPDYGIYIEYFGIDRNKKVAPFFKGKDGKSASEIYNEGIEWKEKLHKLNDTKLIETYYYEKKENNLISKLEKKLKENSVIIEPKTSEELWKTINKNEYNLKNEIINLFGTIINLIKSNDYTFDYLYSLKKINNLKLNVVVLELIEPIYNFYQNYLNQNQMIDFNDMINLAISYVKSNKYTHNYKYVIVDEYQDMSSARFRLLEELRNQKDYKLFCVGDDWQSIYRFSGSDIGLITHFENFWGKTYISFIEKTYRFTSVMSKLSSDFIMKNPNQYKKKLEGKKGNNFSLSFVNGYKENKAIEFLIIRLSKLEKNSTVFLLGRYSFDIKILEKNDNFSIKYDNAYNNVKVILKNREDLVISFITIHKSKGLQADYVVILNNKDYGLGFPSKINDLPIVNILLADGLDDYIYSEERRLFYVALTRAKKKTFLLTIENNKSCFITELEKDYEKLINNYLKNDDAICKCEKCFEKLNLKRCSSGFLLKCSNKECDFFRYL